MTWPRPIRRLLLRAARRAEPALDRVLQTSGQTLEQMAEQVDYYRDQAAMEKQERSSRGEAFRSELEEAIALSHDPWSGPVKSFRESQYATPATRELVKIRETIYGMAELEMALDDRGWKRMIAYSTYEFSRYGIQSLILITRLYFIKHPLIRRGILVSAFYVFGLGMDVSSPDDDGNEELQEFFSDPQNHAVLSHSAFVQHEQALWTDGNLFFVFFADSLTGKTVVRVIDSLEIGDVISDPDDASVPWYYHRQWTEMELSDTGTRRQVQKDAWYQAMGADELPNFKRLATIEGKEVVTDGAGNPIVVMHVKEGYLPKWRFGAPMAYPALDWARAYREGLENLCTVWKALSRVALTVETKGGAPAIAAIKQSLATTFMNDLSTVETNPPAVTGSALISGPGTKINPLKSSGVTVPASEFQRVLLMVCAAFGLGEHMFGDISSGNWATSNALDRPTELMFRERQESWRATVQHMGRHILRQSLTAPKGKLREAIARRRGCETSAVDPDSVLIEMQPVKHAIDGSLEKLFEAARSKKRKATDQITISVTFPAIVEGDESARVNAIVNALTLGGNPVIGIDEKIGIEMLLSELGYEDAHELVEEMYPEQSGDDGYQRDRTVEPEPPPAPTPPAIAAVPGNGAPAVPPAQQEPPAASKKSPLTAREASLLRALAGLQKVIKMREAKQA